MQAVSGRTHGSGKRPRLTSGLQGARCRGRTVSIDSEVRTLDHLNDLRHSHRSVIPILAPFLRLLRHSCGGRNPCECPTVRRASIRPTARQSPRRAAGDRAPSNIGSALDPTDRMDSCLRRNDGQAGVTEGAPVCRTPVRLSNQQLPSQREHTRGPRPHLTSNHHAAEPGRRPPSAPCLRRGRLRHLPPQSGGRAESASAPIASAAC